MGHLSQFCTCRDRACPLHPENHNSGCSPCIADNLKDNEIPSCFFNKIDPDYAGPGYTFDDFARLVMNHTWPLD